MIAQAAEDAEQRLQHLATAARERGTTLGKKPGPGALPSCDMRGPVPPSGCLAVSDLENAPGMLLRHRKGWFVHESCFSRFDGENIVTILDDAWKKIDPELRVDSGGCLGEYNPRWASSVASTVGSGRVLITCGNAKGCAATNFSHRFRGIHSDGKFTKTSRTGEPWVTIGLQQVEACRKGNQMSFPSIIFHETLHGNRSAETMENPLAHDNDAWQRRDACDVVYSTQAVCFEKPGSAYGTTQEQCKTVVARGNPGASGVRLCARFSPGIPCTGAYR